MPYLLVEDFKAGLDVRKSILTAPAGSLTRLVNAAISPGGEISKRRAFVKVANLAGTFGLASIGNKVVAFTRDVVTPNPGIVDSNTGETPTDVVLEYHRLPNSSPTARLSDYDVFDGKLYVVLYDATPAPPTNAEHVSTLPTGVADGKTYLLTSATPPVVKVWQQTAWKDWEANKRVGLLPARGYQGSTFRDLTRNKIFEVDYSGNWAEWKPRDKGAGVPTGADGSGTSSSPVGLAAPDYMSAGDTFLDQTTGNTYVVKAKLWATWYPDSSGAYLPSPQMEGFTVYNYNEAATYVTKGQFWEPWVADFSVTALPRAYADGTVVYNTTTQNYYEWKTSGWIYWTGAAPKASASGATLPQTGNKDDVFLLTTTNKTYVHNGTTWVEFTVSAQKINPHYYFDDRDEVNDQFVQNLDLTWEWTKKKNDKKDTYVETEGSGMGLFVRSYKSKVYAVGDKYLRFSAVDNAFLWEASADTNDTTRTGAGYINVSLQEGGSSQLRGVEIYYDKLALLSEYTTQIWSVTSDPKQAALGQILRATGTKSPWSVQQYGSGDILFLSSSGIRSLKARDLSNSAAVSDIGSPIDEYVRTLPDKYVTTRMTRSGEEVSAFKGELTPPYAVTESDRERFYYNARAILEPIVGRFWLAFPREIMVLSAFPGPNITAWSVYTTPFDIDYIVVAGDRVFVRSGDDLYLFGGVNGKTYDDCGVEVRLPFHDGGKPGHMKLYNAIDATAQGDWELAVACNFDNPDAEELVARISPNDPANPISSSSWNKGRYELSAYSSHMSLRFYNHSWGPATISNCAIHYAIGTDAD